MPHRHGRASRSSPVGCATGARSRPRVPGHLDGWSLVRLPHLFGSPQLSIDDGSPSASPGNRRWRRVLPVTAGALALVLGGGGAAYAAAHKTVTLEVDGARTTVSTFAGSVDGLLADEHVTVGDRDVVAFRWRDPIGNNGEVQARRPVAGRSWSTRRHGAAPRISTSPRSTRQVTTARRRITTSGSPIPHRAPKSP